MRGLVFTGCWVVVLTAALAVPALGAPGVSDRGASACSLLAFDCALSLKLCMPALRASFSACSSTTLMASALRASSTASL